MARTLVNTVGGSGSGGLAPVAITANTAAVTNSMYLANTTANAITLTLPGGTTAATVGVLDALETFATFNLTLAPASGQSIDGYAADDTLVLRFNKANLVLYRAAGTTSWKLQLPSVTSNPVANATDSGLVKNQIQPTSLTSTDLTSQTGCVIEPADISYFRYSMVNGTVSLAFELASITVTAGATQILFTLPVGVPRPLVTTFGWAEIFDNSSSAWALGRIFVLTTGVVGIQKLNTTAFTGGANLTFIQAQLFWHAL